MLYDKTVNTIVSWKCTRLFTSLALHVQKISALGGSKTHQYHRLTLWYVLQNLWENIPSFCCYFFYVIISIYMRCKGRPLFTPHLSYTGIQQSYLLQSHTPDIFLVQAGFCTHASSTCLFSYSIITPSKTGSLVSCFVLCKQKNAKNNKDTEMH